MTEQEQQVWLGMFNAALNGCRHTDPREAAKVADAGLEEFRVRAHPRRSLWDWLFGRARKPALPVYVLHVVELPKEPDEKMFRVKNDGLTAAAGDLSGCRAKATAIRAYGEEPTLQRTDDGGRTWVDVGDDGEPLPPPQPVEEPRCAFVREPEKSADPALSPPPPPADAAEDSTPEAGA